MIDYQTIERIQSAAQIYNVVSDFITLQKRGVNYVGLCPFHEDRTPSFYVSPAKNIYKCFACGEGGTSIHFIMKHEQFSYVEALKYLAKKYDIEIIETKTTDEQKQSQSDRNSMFILNDFAQKTFTNNLFDTEEGRNTALIYFHERGLCKDIIRKFQLGYALENRDAFTQTALKASYKLQYLEKTGLTIIGRNNLSDRFHGRIIFPIHTISGKIVAFGGRILKNVENTGKYVNSPESEIYHKSNELYGIYFARQAMVKQDHCLLVEGYMDVIAMHQAGFENVIASSGTALTQGQIRLIHRFTNNVTVLYDSDIAGIKAALRGINLLLKAGLNTKIVLLPDGEDPDSFSKNQSKAVFQEYIQDQATDFVRFKADLLIREANNDPVKKAHVITEIVDTIALIPEEIVRLIYVKECSKLLDMDERVLVCSIAKKRQEQIVQKKEIFYPDIVQSKEIPTLISLPSTDKKTLGTEQKQSAEQLSPFDEYERNIMYYVVRYGEQFLIDKSENIHINIIEFIASDLKNDEIEFHNPLYRRILEEGYARFRDENFKAEKYFKNHPDPNISCFAANISIDRYIESKIYTKQRIETDVEKMHAEQNKMLLKQVPYVIFNYKDAIVKHQMEKITKQIQQAYKKNDFEKQKELTKQLTILWKNTKKAIALQLRERIITKI